MTNPNKVVPTGSQRESWTINDEIRSRQRVADHGEVFTPPWLVDRMLAPIEEHVARIDSRILEPACGSGNFLVAAFARKLSTVEREYQNNPDEYPNQVIRALTYLYGIELLADNAAECRANLIEMVDVALGLQADDLYHRAAVKIAELNIVQGDALAMKDSLGGALVFPEWTYLGNGQFRRRDFRYHNAVQLASEDNLFGSVDDLEIFTPIRDCGNVGIADIACG